MTQSPILTPDQIAAFHRDGFVHVPGFYKGDEMARITAWTEEVSGWPERPGRHMVYHEDSLREPGTHVVQRIEDVTPFHAGFRDLFADKRKSFPPPPDIEREADKHYVFRV